MGSPEDEEGRFDDETLHQVTLSQAFWMADTACTQALWQAVMGNNPARFKNNLQNPVERVSWEDAQGFIQELKQQIAGLSLRLPTEAEWEYACRAGTSTPFYFGKTIRDTQVNFNKALGKTAPIKSYPPNAWGLYEMHGNVWEWCKDGSPQMVSRLFTGFHRVLRGGSWHNFDKVVRSAVRRNSKLTNRHYNIGFRLAID